MTWIPNYHRHDKIHVTIFNSFITETLAETTRFAYTCFSVDAGVKDIKYSYENECKLHGL